MTFSQNEKAIYLFCAELHQTKTKALTIIEWNTLVKSLANHRLNPEYLLTCTHNEIMQLLSEATPAQKERIAKKVELRKQLGLSLIELDEVIHQGYQIVFRRNMPERLKKLMLNHRPAFYYFLGDLNILNSTHVLGVVGARDAMEDELVRVREISKDAAKSGVIIVSGGARGVDSTATDTVLEAGGNAIIFPSEGLSNWVKKKEVRKYLQNGQLLLLSTQPINARFSGYYAMQRNKFIHATADNTLVASSQISKEKKSGTWEGVLENLKYKWSKLYTIGESPGVKQLQADGQAQPFSTLREVYFSERNLSKILESQLEKLFKNALSAGIEKETVKEITLNQVKKITESQNNVKAEPYIVKEQMTIFDNRQ